MIEILNEKNSLLKKSSSVTDSNSLLIEKDIESHNKPLIEGVDGDEINTNTNKTKNLKKPLVEDSKTNINNNLDELIDVEKDKNNDDSNQEGYICHKPSDLNKIYRGPIDNIKLNSEEIIHNSEYFVLKPSFTTMTIPKTRIKTKKQENGGNGENDGNRVEIQENNKHDVEDLFNVPDRNLYIGIGFNKNDNKFHTYNENKGGQVFTL